MFGDSSKLIEVLSPCFRNIANQPLEVYEEHLDKFLQSMFHQPTPLQMVVGYDQTPRMNTQS